MQSFIYIEPSEEGIDSVTEQIASRVRKISSGLRGPMKGICIGNHLEGKESGLSGLMDELITVEVPSGSEYNTEVICNVLTDVVGGSRPGLLLFGFTHHCFYQNKSLSHNRIHLLSI